MARDNEIVRHDQIEYDDSQPLLTDANKECSDIEAALDIIGYGSTHWLVMLACAWACTSDSVEIVCISFILPAAECELQLSSLDKGWLNGMIFGGMLVGGMVWGAAGDAIGRRGSLIWSLMLNATAAVASALAPNFTLFLLLRFVSGIGVGGSYPVVFAYFVEWQPRRWRGAAVAGLSCCWMLGGMMAAAAAWLLVPHPDWLLIRVGSVPITAWRLFVIVCAVPSATSAVLFPFLPESPKFLIQNGRTRQATNLLNSLAARYGRATVDRPAFGKVHLSNDDRGSSSSSSSIRKMLHSLKQLVSKRYRRRITVLVFVQFTLAFGYYGLLLWFPELFKRVQQFGGTPCNLGNQSRYLPPSNSSSSSSNNSSNDNCSPQLLSSIRPFAESFAVNSANLPGNLLSVLLIERIGRRLLLCSSMLLTACSIFAVTIVSTQSQALGVSCAFAGLSASGWNALNVISTELLPTHLRSTALGLSGAISRVGSMLANVAFGAFIDAGCAMPLTITAVLLCAGGLASTLFPDLSVV